jgi:hypothetical protein
VSEFSKRLMMPTDVAHIVIFHPDDLAHCSGWPIAWYSEPFVFPVESEARRLIAWCTRSDGSFAVRLTNGDLSDREKQYAGDSWVFPYSVRHGRVFLDNTDTLPGMEQMTETSDNEDYWIDVPNGDYAVCVTGIEWDAEPGAETEDFQKLPNYVVRFMPMGDQAIAPARRPPDIISAMDAKASDEVYASSPAMETPEPLDPWLPAFASQNVRPAPFSFQSKGEAPVAAAVKDDGDRFDIFDKKFVVVPNPQDIAIGNLGILASIHGSSSSPGEAVSYEMRGQEIVRIVAVDGMFRNGEMQPLAKKGFLGFGGQYLPDDALPAVAVKAVRHDHKSPLPWSAELASTVESISQSLKGDGALARLLGGTAGYEELYIRSVRSPESLSKWLLEHLPIASGEAIRISALPGSERLQALIASFEAL